MFGFFISCLCGIKVVDGGSLKINGAKVRLYGLDAPEHDQTCESDGSEYSCGQDSKIALQGLITDETFCVIKGGDRYKRVLAICYNSNKYQCRACKKRFCSSLCSIRKGLCKAGKRSKTKQSRYMARRIYKS